MSVKAAALLGFFLVIASILHGGVYAPGHDFILNRFTGWYEFVPADDVGDDDATEAVGSVGAACALTSRRPGVRVARSGVVHGGWRAARVGR